MFLKKFVLHLLFSIIDHVVKDRFSVICHYLNLLFLDLYVLGDDASKNVRDINVNQTSM